MCEDKHKIKAYLRMAKDRTKNMPDVAITEALNSITTSDIMGWFEENNYGIC